MSGKMLVTFAALVFWLIPAVAPAVPLFPLQLGGYSQFDGSDAIPGHQWKSRIWVVAENISLNSQTYYHVRLENWDPYQTNSMSMVEDNLIRSTETQGWLSLGGSEWLMFQTGPPEVTTWTYTAPWGDVYCDIWSFGSVTVPAGTFSAYTERTRGVRVTPPGFYDPDWFYLVPGLGLIKEVADNVESGRAPRTTALSGTGVQGVSLFPLKTGMRLIYDASDKPGNKWQMTMLVQEQVTFGGHTYFRMRQNNYSSGSGGEGDREFYLRCSANQAWISYDGVTEHLAFQAAGPGTSWNYPDPWDPGTDYINIASIGPINVMGGSFLAYRHDGTFTGGGSWVDYVVPGVGIARREDSDLPGPARAPLIFILTKITQGNAGPAVNLLLLD